MNANRIVWLLMFVAVAVPAQPPQQPRPPEQLQRGLAVVPQDGGKAFVSWRLLAGEGAGTAFNLYRVTGSAAPLRLNQEPLAEATSYQDSGVDLAQENSYFVRPLHSGKEGDNSRSFLNKLAARPTFQDYFEIRLSLPSTYTPNDASAADLDGDGEYEIILKAEQRPRDTASTGLTGETLLQGYRLDGRCLWTINLGRNVREGAHYCQFIAFDFDGDGRAEIGCKTADGTIDGLGKAIGDPAADWRETNQASRVFGRVVRGPEYLTIFDGRSGAALATTDYLPPRGDLGAWGGIGGNGGNDTVGNRADRFLACVAYLDGTLPSLVMCRGYYGRSVLAAWDWRDGKLTSRWIFDTAAAGSGKDGKPNHAYGGMGAHSVSVADVDQDGKDEIVYHSMVVDDDGQGLFTTGLRHGDALHVGDLDPSREGLEVFGVHENEGATVKLRTPGVAAYDARTGEILWSASPGGDMGRGLTADIDPRHAGAEMWTSPSLLRTCKGVPIGPAPRSVNFAVWWDGDLLRELLDGNRIYKWNWEKEVSDVLFEAEDCRANNGSKATPALCADLIGDWREEVLLRSADNKTLRLYTTTIPSSHRFRTLMQDRHYRLSVASQNVGYNQPPHPSFFLGKSIKNFQAEKKNNAAPSVPGRRE